MKKVLLMGLLFVLVLGIGAGIYYKKIPISLSPGSSKEINSPNVVAAASTTDEYDAYFHGGTVVYNCNDHKTITAVYALPNPAYYNSVDDVSLTLSDGRHFDLTNAHIANGGRFSNSDMSVNFWGSGQNDDWLEENGKITYSNCQDPKYTP